MLAIGSLRPFRPRLVNHPGVGPPLGAGGALELIGKRWAADGVVAHLFGYRRPVERLMGDRGFIERTNGTSGLYLPILASTQFEAEDWIILEDVGEELSRYDSVACDEGCHEWDCFVLDRISRLHVRWESGSAWRYLDANRDCFVPQEYRLRWFELLYGAWFGQESARRYAAPLQRAVGRWERMREQYQRFLDWLPAGDRASWRVHMLDRSSLVRVASDFPCTLIHGHLNRRNTGVRQSSGLLSRRDPGGRVSASGSGGRRGPPRADSARCPGRTGRSAPAHAHPSITRPRSIRSRRASLSICAPYGTRTGQIPGTPITTMTASLVAGLSNCSRKRVSRTYPYETSDTSLCFADGEPFNTDYDLGWLDHERYFGAFYEKLFSLGVLDEQTVLEAQKEVRNWAKDPYTSMVPGMRVYAAGQA